MSLIHDAIREVPIDQSAPTVTQGHSDELILRSTDDPHSITHQSEGDSRVRKGLAGDEALLDRLEMLHSALMWFTFIYTYAHSIYKNFPAHCSGCHCDGRLKLVKLTIISR